MGSCTIAILKHKNYSASPSIRSSCSQIGQSRSFEHGDQKSSHIFLTFFVLSRTSSRQYVTWNSKPNMSCFRHSIYPEVINKHVIRTFFDFFFCRLLLPYHRFGSLRQAILFLLCYLVEKFSFLQMIHFLISKFSILGLTTLNFILKKLAEHSELCMMQTDCL